MCRSTMYQRERWIEYRIPKASFCFVRFPHDEFTRTYTQASMCMSTCHQEDRRVLKVSEILRPTCDKFALSPFRSLLNVIVETILSIGNTITSVEQNHTIHIQLKNAVLENWVVNKIFLSHLSSVRVMHFLSAMYI